MPLLVTGARGPWSRTPTRRVWTERYRIVSCPRLGEARAVQREAFDWALGEMETSPGLPVRARAGHDSLWGRLTGARAHGALPRAPLALQRAASAQAHEAFAKREAHLEAKARTVALEQSEDPAPRVVRRLARPPKAPARYRRSHPANLRRRQAIAVLEGVRVAGPRAVHVPGLGSVTIERDVVDTPRSVQVVEEAGRPAWLHVQHGEALPTPKDPYGKTTGLDAGVRHTLTACDGSRLERPDTTSLLAEAKRLMRHATRRCTRGSRADRRLRSRARALRRRAANVHDNAECHMAKRLSEANDVVVLENLALANMTASARGTSTAPGSAAKRGLNDALAKARLAKLHQRIERRCVRDGTWCVKVHPGGTSTTCSRCGHRDPKSRRGALFHCTGCRWHGDADENAARNIAARGIERIEQYCSQRGAGDWASRDGAQTDNAAVHGPGGRQRAFTGATRPSPGRRAGARQGPAMDDGHAVNHSV